MIYVNLTGAAEDGATEGPRSCRSTRGGHERSPCRDAMPNQVRRRAALTRGSPNCRSGQMAAFDLNPARRAGLLLQQPRHEFHQVAGTGAIVELVADELVPAGPAGAGGTWQGKDKDPVGNPGDGA